MIEGNIGWGRPSGPLGGTMRMRARTSFLGLHPIGTRADDADPVRIQFKTIGVRLLSASHRSRLDMAVVEVAGWITAYPSGVSLCTPAPAGVNSYGPL